MDAREDTEFSADFAGVVELLCSSRRFVAGTADLAVAVEVDADLTTDIAGGVLSEGLTTAVWESGHACRVQVPESWSGHVTVDSRPRGRNMMAPKRDTQREREPSKSANTQNYALD